MTYEEGRRPENPYACSANKPPASPSRPVGEEVACWKPKIPVELISEQFQCLNDPCMKIHDPHMEAANALEDAEQKIMLGKIFVGAGSALFLGTLVWMARTLGVC